MRLGLCEEAGEAAAPTSGGAQPPAPAHASTPEAPKPETKPPGVVDRAISMFKDKGSLMSEITTLKGQLAAITTERDGLKAQLAAITTERDGLKAQFLQLETALTAEQGKNKDVQAEVTHQLATVGVPAAMLPAAKPSTASAEDAPTVEAINAQIEKETDPRKRGELANKAWDLMKAGSAKPGGKN